MLQDKLQGSTAIEVIYLQPVNGVYYPGKRVVVKEQYSVIKKGGFLRLVVSDSARRLP